jgi:SAM-dependent methyltransferase
MAIGDFYGTIARNRVSKLLCYFLGVPDFHTHLRIKPMLKFLKKYFYATKSATINILELGCGSGINGFEISKLAMRFGKKLNYVGVDLSEESIKIAREISKKFEGNTELKFSFYNSDANIFLQNYSDNDFDIILLIDFIEHIGSPEITLRLANKKLRADGLFLVSVPTPLYPKVFGRKFHEKIGHLVDGYTINLLDTLFESINCNRLSNEYNTGLIGSFACWVYYNKLGDERIRNKYINFISWLVLYPLKFLDIFNGPGISCSLFAVYKKK